MEDKDKTTIQISKKTLSRLKAFKVIGKESYDEALNRLMNKVLGNNKE